MSDLQIKIFPCLNDNYGILLHDHVTGETAAIDTPEASKIIAAAKDASWNITQIWNTHHHWDHTGGNLELKDKYTASVTGPANERVPIPGIDRSVADGDIFQFGKHDVRIIETPGHTLGAICYYIPSAKMAFVGDTLFVLGCGRLFEGTPQQMYDSLQAICALPDDTRLYCGHEYTVSNGIFAKTVEPDNTDLLDYLKQAKAQREHGEPTVPSTVALEKKANPFVRAGSAKRLGEIRTAKDNFSG